MTWDLGFRCNRCLLESRRYWLKEERRCNGSLPIFIFTNVVHIFTQCQQCVRCSLVCTLHLFFFFFILTSAASTEEQFAPEPCHGWAISEKKTQLCTRETEFLIWVSRNIDFFFYFFFYTCLTNTEKAFNRSGLHLHWQRDKTRSVCHTRRGWMLHWVKLPAVQTVLLRISHIYVQP